MAHLLSDLANYFKLDEINIDNWTFKLYYKVSMVICMTGATVGIASQYFGDPIRSVLSSCKRTSLLIPNMGLLLGQSVLEQFPRRSMEGKVLGV